MAGTAHREAVVHGVRLHVAEAGEGPLVVLLHGFPECWYSWRHQIAALADAGYRVLAPDQRGYGDSDKPRGVAAYRLSALVADVVGLIREAGCERASVVGHDWGGAVAWQLAISHPEMVERLAVLNVPHPVLFLRELTSNPVQMLKSWYMLFFQLPWLPEAVLRAGDFALLERAMRRGPVRRDAFTAEDVQVYKAAWRKPGAMTAMVNWYRAMARYRADANAQRGLEVPTLQIWGERDAYLGVGMTYGLDRWVRDVRVECLPDASHWVQNDAPETVNALLVEFLKNASSKRR